MTRLEHHYPRHAGHRVHDRGTAASISCRRASAKRTRRGPPSSSAVGHDRGGVDHARRGRIARNRSGVARPAPAPDARSEGPSSRLRGHVGLKRVPRGAGMAERSCWDAGHGGGAGQSRGVGDPRRVGGRRRTTIHGMIPGERACLTAHGGMNLGTAAVRRRRGMGKAPASRGCEGLEIDQVSKDGCGSAAGEVARRATRSTIGRRVPERVIVGEVPLVPSRAQRGLRDGSLGWADDVPPPERCEQMRTTPRTPRKRVSFGAPGDRPLWPDRAHVSAATSGCTSWREMILASDEEGEDVPRWSGLLPFQQSDFRGDLRGRWRVCR